MVPACRFFWRMSQRRTIVAGTFGFALLTACSAGFDAASVLEDAKVNVNGEQVVVTTDQVLCGEREGLWRIQQQSQGALGRLTPEAHALGFADDVVMGNTRFSEPFAQVGGMQQLKVSSVSAVTDDDAATKTVSASVGVVIKHSCFENPLPMHGAEGGSFSQRAEPRFQLKDQTGWKVDRILH
jgi:hypothetical protein